MRLSEVIGRDLKWTQPRAMKMEYELSTDDKIVATLRFRSSFDSYAVAESADGRWSFKRVGFWKTRVVVRAMRGDAELALYKNNIWRSGGILELPDGRCYHMKTDFWSTRYEFRNEAGAVVRHQNIKGIFHTSSEVNIRARDDEIIELPWLVMLGWYLVLMAQKDTSAE